MRSGFFNSNLEGYDTLGNPIYDRAEEASFFAEFFAAFIGNGVYPNPSTGMQVVENSKLGATVKAGKCFINGYFGLIESAGEEVSFDTADSNFSRIDRVVARWDLQKRDVNLHVLKGTPASNPVAPALTRNSNIYELALADVRIPKDTTVVTQANITDTRLDKSLCGIVTGVIEQLDTTSLFNQYLSWFEEMKQKSDDDYKDWFDGFTIPSEDSFKEWFNNLKVQLSGDVAGNLQNEIDDLLERLSSANELIESINTALSDKMDKAGGVFSGIIKTENVTPAKDAQHDLGSPGSLWRTVYTNKLILPMASVFSTDGLTVIGVMEYLSVRDSNDIGVFRPISASSFDKMSSRRYKKNIREMTEEEANKLDEIETVIFDYINEKNGTNVAGTIAEQVYEVLPNVVTLAEVDGKRVPDSIDYSNFVTYLIKRDQMKSKKIKEQEERMDSLEKRILELESKE